MVETTDIVFAVDSIPAILGITHNAFIVYTSNVFAILGLRALYFVLAGMLDSFHYLKYGLSVILIFVGLKMLVEGLGYNISTGMSLGIVAGILALSIIASLLHRRPDSDAGQVEG
jgi:tellurite resistance protein TerC